GVLGKSVVLQRRGHHVELLLGRSRELGRVGLEGDEQRGTGLLRRCKYGVGAAADFQTARQHRGGRWREGIQQVGFGDLVALEQRGFVGPGGGAGASQQEQGGGSV